LLYICKKENKMGKRGRGIGKWMWLLGGIGFGLLVIVGSMWSGDDIGVVEVIEVRDSVGVDGGDIEDSVGVSDYFPELSEEELEYREDRGGGYASSGIEEVEEVDYVRSAPEWYGLSSRELARELVGGGRRGNYVKYHIDYAIDHMVRYGIPASLSLGQALKETGGGSRLSMEANNHFGIKARYRECVNGDWELNELNGFWMFGSTGECYEYRSLMLTGCHYGQWISEGMGLEGWLKVLINGGREDMRWCPDDDYVDTIRSIIERYDLEKVDRWVESRYGIGI